MNSSIKDYVKDIKDLVIDQIKNTSKRLCEKKGSLRYSSSILGAAFDDIRQMGFITLPHPTTLQKQVHIKGCDGSNKSLYVSFKKTIGKDSTGTILFYEIKILGRVAFNSKDGSMVGFVHEQYFKSSLNGMMQENEKKKCHM